MPQHSIRGSDAFKFDLAAPARWSYAPGDTIIGNLMRKTAIVTPQATISLSFEGRSKVKIVRSGGHSKREIRDVWQIIRPRESIIYEGPLHLPEGSDEALTWPISLDIPLKPTQLSAWYDTTCSFLPMDESHPVHHTLPGSWFSQDPSVVGLGRSSSFVEYFLTAHLRYQHGGQDETHEAVCPIIMRHSIPETHRLGVPHMFTARNKVSTHRLLPGMKKAELSFKQHAQKFFGSSKVSQFAYTLRLTVPTSIRLNDSTPLPLQLEVVQNPESTSDSVKDVAQNIELSELQAVLRGQTTDRAVSSGLLGVEQSHSYDQKAVLDLQYVLDRLESRLVITTGKKSEPLHLGNILQLTLCSIGLRYGGQIVPVSSGYGCSIYPDLTTHNIRRTHCMEWKIGLKIAGETEIHRFTNGVQIIGEA